MTRDVVTVTPDSSLKDVAGLLAARHISGVPVCADDGAVLGVVSEADILRKEEGVSPEAGGRFTWLFRRMDSELDKVAARTAGEAMTAPARTVSPRAQVTVAARLMLRHKINRLPVVLGDRLVGIVSRADLVRAFHRSDAEIEREIREETLDKILWIAPESLQLHVEDGLVTISGRVDTPSDVEAVCHYVRAVPGVTDVQAKLEAHLSGRKPERLS
jgi:CBS domain-containing protein